MNKTRKLIIVALTLFIATTLASAALLQYFGKVQTTMNVQQSIVIGDGEDWYNYNEPVSRNLGDVVHCTDYCYKLLIWNRACRDANVFFDDVCTLSPVWNGGWDDEGIDITHHVFGDTQTIELTHKDAGWNPIGEPILLTFNTCGPTFDYTLSSLPDGYTLVYYIDQIDRFVNWGKVFVVGSTISGSVDIPTMPYADDCNANGTYIYGGYEHTSGAKFWLIPSDIIENGQMQEWDASEYYFETDLALYIDCDDWTPYCLPYVFPQFDTEVLQAESIYCWITCYHIAFDIVGGTYSFDTILDATEII